jgi:hypothetical protein
MLTRKLSEPKNHNQISLTVTTTALVKEIEGTDALVLLYFLSLLPTGVTLPQLKSMFNGEVERNLTKL